jgi:hypothetical protein
MGSFVLALTTGATVAACGGSGSDAGTTPGAVQASAGGASAAASPGSHRSGSPAASATVAPSAATSEAAGKAPAVAASGSAAPAGPAPAAGAVPLPPPGTYTYRQHGTAKSALGDQSLDGDSTLTVDQPQGSREHSTQRDRGGSTEQVLVSQAGGLYLAEIHLSQTGFDEDFKPAQPVLLFPGNAHKGQQWQWHMTSTDGKYTLNARLTVTDLSSSGVTLSSVIHLTSSDINLTIHQRDRSGTDAVIVREHAVTDGTAYGTPFHSDVTRVLTDRP